MNLRIAAPLTALLAVAGGALGQGRFTPQSIIVTPAPTNLTVNVALDRAGTNPVYRIGDPITVSVTTNQDAYVYLFNIDQTNNTVDVILPNRYSAAEATGFIPAGQTRTFGASGNFRFNVGGPVGQNKVVAVASKTPFNQQRLTQQVFTFQGTSPVATPNVEVRTQENLARALSIVVSPAPSAPAPEIATDEANYQVVSNVATPPAPTTGSFVIEGIPNGAQVYVDGILVGRSPATFTTQPGVRTIRIVLEGYREFTGTVNIQPGRVTTFRPNLVAIPRTGSLTVRSNSANTQVFINGNSYGQVGGDGVLVINNLPAGTHELTVVTPGTRTLVRDITITGGQSTTVDARR